MDNELEKIDAIRSRMRVSYAEARKALDEASGDVVNALEKLESGQGRRTDLLALGVELADEVQKVVNGGPIRKLKVRYGERTVVETPVALTALAALAVGLAAVLISKLIIEVEKGEEEGLR